MNCGNRQKGLLWSENKTRNFFFFWKSGSFWRTFCRNERKKERVIYGCEDWERSKWMKGLVKYLRGKRDNKNLIIHSKEGHKVIFTFLNSFFRGGLFPVLFLTFSFWFVRMMQTRSINTIERERKTSVAKGRICSFWQPGRSACVWWISNSGYRNNSLSTCMWRTEQKPQFDLMSVYVYVKTPLEKFLRSGNAGKRYFSAKYK